MSFAHPGLLPWLVALCCVAALALRAARQRADRRLERLLGSGRPRSARRGDRLLLLALFALAVALAGPRWGTQRVRLPASGVDVAILLDVSLSMAARDTPPSRLDRARRTAQAVLARLAPGDRAALAVFAGRGVLLAPLTSDKQALGEFLPALDATLMAEQGSRLDDGVRAALESLRSETPRPRVLLVLSDGEAIPAGPESGAELAEAPGVRIVTAAFGDEEGATIPTVNGPLLDARGHTVTSRRDAGRLAALADASGGAAFRADRWGEVDPAALVAALRRDANAAPEGWIERELPASRSAPLVLFALALLLVEATPPRWARRAPGRVAAAGSSALLLGALLGTAGAAEQARPPAGAAGPAPGGRQLLALGVQRALRGELREAERAFFAAAVRAEDPRVAADAYYDLGVAALQRGDLPRASEAFFDALALAPEDREARFNLEWTLRQLETLPIPPAPAEREEQEEDSSAEQTAEASGAGTEDAREQRPGSAPEAKAARGEPERQPALSPEEAARWLDSLRDDPAGALRSALGNRPGLRARRTDPPAW